MIKKYFYFCLLFLLLSNASFYAQSNEVLARSYFVKAQEAYSANNNLQALENLDKALEYLGNTNAKVEALYVKIALSHRDYISADKHLTNYFEIANESRSDYMVMLGHVVDVKEKKENLYKSLIFNDGLAALKIRGKWGFVDEKYNVIIECKYDQVEDFHNRISIVKKNNKYGLIDLNGNQITPCIYNDLKQSKITENGYYDAKKIVKYRTVYGLINLNGEEVITCEYTKIEPFGIDGLVKVMKAIGEDEIGEKFILKDEYYREERKRRESYGIINYQTAKTIIDVEHYSIEMLYSNNFVVQPWRSKRRDGELIFYYTNDKFFVYQYDMYNKTGIIIEENGSYMQLAGSLVTKYKIINEGIYRFSNWDPVERASRYKIRNFKNNTESEYFDSIWYFRSGGGMAAVENNGKYGFINLKCELVVPMIYDNFKGGSFDNNYGYYRKGSHLIAIEKIGGFDSNIGYVQKGKKWIRIDKNGNEIGEVEKR